MSSTATYWQAVDYAQTMFDAFYDQHERIERAYAEGRGNDNLTRLMEREEQKLAAATCAQTDMIGHLFGMGEEQVQGDLMHLRNEARKTA